MKICTWNTCGDPTTNTNKAGVLGTLWHSCDIILLQECGNLSNVPAVLTGANVIHEYQAGAFNPRCSTALLSKAVPDSSETVYSPSGTGRSVIVAAFDGVLVGTLHAVSGGVGAQDLRFAVINAVGSDQPWVIGGDFNVTPGSAALSASRTTMNFGSSSRPITASWKAPSGPTQTSGGRLDYFVYNGVTVTGVTRHHSQGGSDHKPVYCDVS
ncbi:MAG: endonuclease/exonuclease/phosphatase family protein [Magnetovibrionaceae bacterium]